MIYGKHANVEPVTEQDLDEQPGLRLMLFAWFKMEQQERFPDNPLWMHPFHCYCPLCATSNRGPHRPKVSGGDA